MQIVVINHQEPDKVIIATAVAALKSGEVIAYLTDTLYGLGGDARSLLAIEKVFTLKGRAAEKALPVIIGAPEMAEEYVETIPAVAQKLIGKFWPGPLTLIFKASAQVLSLLIGHTGKIAVRLPNTSLARALSNGLGAPIIATSSNRSGAPALNSARQIAETFGERLSLILDSGPPRHSQPSTIIDVTVQPPGLVRAGAVPVAEIIQQIGELRT